MITSSKPARLKRLDMAEKALESLRHGSGGFDHDISTDARYLELVKAFGDLTQTTVGSYCRELGDEEIPEPVLALLREMVWILHGRNAAVGASLPERIG